MQPEISVVIPVYFEEEVLPQTYERLTSILRSGGYRYELIFVDDGSLDKTPEILQKLTASDNCIKTIRFSRNFGQMAAITAGLHLSSGDAVICIDADLQDPPELIPQMIEAWQNGYDVVYGKRLKRKGESLFKKITAKMHYRLLKRMTNVDIQLDTGEFRLISRKVCNAINALPEQNRYVRGLVSWAGFSQTSIEYVRDERFAGETKYPLRKMVELSLNGMASFSKKPLRFAFYMGIFTFFLSCVLCISSLVVGFQIWMLPVTILFFLMSFLFVSIGIMGEYIGRIYDEARGRPNYIIESTNGFSPNENNHNIK
ncbi:MAG: glycosyltransferase family 2 protein [Defluviitaleaceae bacterium]|nr:glycosyltransferase family 2 protein [Defluviitaleaceae bacterium]